MDRKCLTHWLGQFFIFCLRSFSSITSACQHSNKYSQSVISWTHVFKLLGLLFQVAVSFDPDDIESPFGRNLELASKIIQNLIWPNYTWQFRHSNPKVLCLRLPATAVEIASFAGLYCKVNSLFLFEHFFFPCMWNNCFSVTPEEIHKVSASTSLPTLCS